MADKEQLEINISPTISPQAMAALQKQFSVASEESVSNALKELQEEAKHAELSQLKDVLSGKAGQQAKEQASQKWHGGISTGVGAAQKAASLDIKGGLSMAGPYGQAAAGMISAFEMATDTIKQFVSVANPQVMEQFDLAVRDISGVIGQSLTPVIEAAIPWVRMFGDLLASIIPDAKAFNDALKPLQNALVEFKTAIDPLIPLIKGELMRELGMLAEQFAMLVQVLTWQLKLVTFIPNLIAEQINGDKSGSNWKSGEGAAARSGASYSGIAEAGRSMQLAGFNSLRDQSYNANIAAAKSLAKIEAKTGNTGSEPVATGNA